MEITRNETGYIMAAPGQRVALPNGTIYECVAPACTQIWPARDFGREHAPNPVAASFRQLRAGRFYGPVRPLKNPKATAAE